MPEIFEFCLKNMFRNFDYVPHRRAGRHIVFGVDPVGVGVSVGVGVTQSSLHDMS